MRLRSAKPRTRPPDYGKVLFTDDLGEDWTQAHRDDPPIRPDDMEYLGVKAQMNLLKARFEAALEAGDKGKEEAEASSLEYSRCAWRIAPSRWLPFELIGCILRELVEDTPSSFTSVPLHKVLFLTCRPWRDVAIRSPEVWQRIDIDGRCGKPELWDRRYMEKWLDRSGSLPLRVEITCLEGGTPIRNRNRQIIPSTRTYKQLLPLAKAYRRIESLTLAGDVPLTSFHAALAACLDVGPCDSKRRANDFIPPSVRGLKEEYFNLEALQSLKVSHLLYCFTLPNFQAEKLTIISLYHLSFWAEEYAQFVQGTPNARSVELLKVTIFNSLAVGPVDTLDSFSWPEGHRRLEMFAFQADIKYHRNHHTLLKPFCDMIRCSNLLKTVRAYARSNMSLGFDCSLWLVDCPDHLNTIRAAVSNVTTLDLGLGFYNFLEIPSLVKGMVPFLETFPNVEHFTFKTDTWPDYLDQVESSSPVDGGIIVGLSFRLFGTLKKMQRLKTIRLLSLPFYIDHFFHLVDALSQRTEPPQLTLDEDCYGVKDKQFPPIFMLSSSSFIADYRDDFRDIHGDVFRLVEALQDRNVLGLYDQIYFLKKVKVEDIEQVMDKEAPQFKFNVVAGSDPWGHSEEDSEYDTDTKWFWFDD